MMTDLFALRQMRNRREFTLLAVITLALGIGLNTAHLSVFNSTIMFLLFSAQPCRFREAESARPMSSPPRRAGIRQFRFGGPRYNSFS